MSPKVAFASWAVFSGLLAAAVPAPAADCESRTHCWTCTLDGGITFCEDLQTNGFCHCTVSITHPFACTAWDSCDYTGPPSCPNPTPEGECPQGFGPSPPEARAASDTGPETLPEPREHNEHASAEGNRAGSGEER